MNEIATQTASLFGNFVGGAILGGILVWAFARWYYTKSGRAKLQAREAELIEQAKAQGVILREAIEK